MCEIVSLSFFLFFIYIIFLILIITESERLLILNDSLDINLFTVFPTTKELRIIHEWINRRINDNSIRLNI